MKHTAPPGHRPASELLPEQRWSATAETEGTEPPADPGPPHGDDRPDWGRRVREWAAQLGDWVDALLPAPRPVPVPVPVRVRRRRR